MIAKLWSGDETMIKNYVSDNFGHIDGFTSNARAIGWVAPVDDPDQLDGKSLGLVGGVVLEPRGGNFDAELSICLEPGCRITRAHLKALFEIAFVTFGLLRLTCHVAKSNKEARKFMSRLGFLHEGTMVRGYDGYENAFLYGMPREKCKWIDAHDLDAIAA